MVASNAVGFLNHFPVNASVILITGAAIYRHLPTAEFVSLPLHNGNSYRFQKLTLPLILAISLNSG